METMAEPKTRNAIVRPADWNMIEAAGENILERFQEDLRDIGLDIELFNNRMGNMVRPWVPPAMLPMWQHITTPLDIAETGTSYEVRMNLPGVPKELVEIKFLDQTLEIDAGKKAMKETEKKSYVLRERSEMEYHRRVSFPTPVTPEKAEAKLDHGVLVVNVPKLKPAKELRVPLV